METLIALLIFVLILVAAYYIITLVPDARAQKILHVVVLIIAIFWLIRHLPALLR